MRICTAPRGESLSCRPLFRSGLWLPGFIPAPPPVVALMSTDRLHVFVYSGDPMLQAGAVGQMRLCHDVALVDDVDSAAVALVVADEVDQETARLCRVIARSNGIRIALVAARLDEAGLMAGIEAGVIAFVRRSEAVPERLSTAVRSAASGEGYVPPDLIGKMMLNFGRLKSQMHSPRGLSINGFSDREIDVLRMVADGHDTSEIAHRLCFSERTVKGIIHDVTTRFQLRNRAQAVAYAARQGLL
jgi:DNA-binding NarL/FixJ family response regulator